MTYTKVLGSGDAMRKTPRDFVHIDEFWDADEHWPRYFLAQKVWVFVDEYRAELTGDEDYSRICIHADNTHQWQYIRPLSSKQQVHQILSQIKQPVSEDQLQNLGFVNTLVGH